MKDLAISEEWSGYILSYFDNLKLYLAEKKRDYSENEIPEIGLINQKGQ